MQNKHPEIQNTFEFYEMDKHEQQMDNARKMLWIDQNYPEFFPSDDITRYPYFAWLNRLQGLLPGFGLHYSMFRSVTQALCDEE